LFSLTREGHRPRALQPAYLTLLEETFAHRGPQSAAKVAALAVIRAGAAGLNLEDPVDTEPPGRVGSFGKGDASELVEPEEQAERIRAAVEVGRVAGGPLVVNARTDVYWREIGDPEERFAETVRRGRAYLDAGAECVFVPGVKDTDTIAALVREIPGPLNILAGPGSPSVAELARLGVRRVSVGLGPARAAMGLTRRIGRELLQSGTYSSLGGDALPYTEANALFEGHSPSKPPGGI
jgi:2-methylisocitrate lyase-like PEP mutase family enzyme